MKNPHSPSGAWLRSIAGVGGYKADPDVGDSGEHFMEMTSGTFKVTVEKVDE